MRQPSLTRVVFLAAALFSGIALGFPMVRMHAAKLQAGRPHRLKAVAFDYFVLFNPDSVLEDVEQMFPGKGREFTNLWRTRQFEYTWLRSITHRYVDFSVVTEDALGYTANAMNLALSGEARRRLLNSYFHLRPWPDTVNALRRLHEIGD